MERYTAEQISLIDRLRDVDRRSWDDIAKALGGGRSGKAVRHRYDYCRTPQSVPRPNPDRARRMCLGCSETFESAHVGNRMCEPCLKRPVMRS